jgi:hypothetical protein
MKVIAAAAVTAFLALPISTIPAQADPHCFRPPGGDHGIPSCVSNDDPNAIVQVQNPDDPNGAPMQMTQTEAALIATPPPPNSYPNVWTLKPQATLMQEINSGSNQVTRVVCMGMPSTLRPPNCNP